MIRETRRWQQKPKNDSWFLMSNSVEPMRKGSLMNSHSAWAKQPSWILTLLCHVESVISQIFENTKNEWSKTRGKTVVNGSRWMEWQPLHSSSQSVKFLVEDDVEVSTNGSESSFVSFCVFYTTQTQAREKQNRWIFWKRRSKHWNIYHPETGDRIQFSHNE